MVYAWLEYCRHRFYWSMVAYSYCVTQIFGVSTNFLPERADGENESKPIIITLRHHAWRDSDHGATTAIRVKNEFKPVWSGLIRDKAELVSGRVIARKLDLAVNFTLGRFKVGHREWEAMTYNDKNRWVFSLFPHSSAFENCMNISGE